MDPAALVSPAQVEGGRILLERLPASGVVTTGAVWAQIEGDRKPYLYILAPNIEVEGALSATRRLVEALREPAPDGRSLSRYFDTFAVQLIGPSDPLARAMATWYQLHPYDDPFFHRGSSLGTVSLDGGAYIYPAAMFAAPAAATSPAAP